MEKLLIKEKINLSEKARLLLNHGVKDTALINTLWDDMGNMAEAVTVSYKHLDVYKRQVIDREHKKNRLHLHFLLDDNPSLPQEVKERYENMYSGVFRDRYILGKWTVAEGLIYPEVAAGLGIVPSVPRNYVKYAISIDYGTLNPCSMGLWGLCDGVWYRFKEFYHNGRERRRQLTDEEYYQELYEIARLNLFDSMAHITYPIRYMNGKHHLGVDLSRMDDLIDLTLRTPVSYTHLEVYKRQAKSGCPFCGS